MKTNIVFLKAETGFTRTQKSRIKGIIQRTVDDASKELPFPNEPMNFIVYPFDGEGTEGVAYAPYWINLLISARFFEEKSLKGWTDDDELAGITYHEYHHIARGYWWVDFVNGKDNSLLNSFFSEGLAISYEMQKVPGRIPEYAEYTPELLQKWLPELIGKFAEKDGNYDYDEWFCDEEGKKPIYFGYKIGKGLVDRILLRYPELSLLSLARISAKDLLKLSGMV